MADRGCTPSGNTPPAGQWTKRIAGTGFLISPLREDDADEAAWLYVRVFLADEPTSNRIAPDPESLLPSAQWYVRSLISRGFSSIARDEGSQEIAGILFAFDITDDFRESGDAFARYLAHFREAVIMIDELEQQCPEIVAAAPGSVLHIIQGAVAGRFRNRGIMKALLHCTIASARKRGYCTIIADCTNAASYRAFAECGFKKRAFLSYDTFAIGGFRFFAGLEGGISLMVLDLQAP